jgi:hypothetical protein
MTWALTLASARERDGIIQSGEARCKQLLAFDNDGGLSISTF